MSFYDYINTAELIAWIILVKNKNNYFCSGKIFMVLVDQIV